MIDDDVATCRGCGRILRGSPYWKGGAAYVPDTGEQAKKNYYGGWVCSSSCDYRSSLELEQSMPGHGGSQKRLGSSAQNHYNNNWG